MEKPKRNPEIIWRIEKRREEEVLTALEAGEDVDDSGTVTLMLSGMMHQLNLVGGLIWQQCDGTKTVAEIAEDLGREFDVAKAVIASDVVDFVNELKERGWLIDG